MFSERGTVVELPWAADCCPCVEELRAVLPLSGGVVRLRVGPAPRAAPRVAVRAAVRTRGARATPAAPPARRRRPVQ
jgi:hypothetical protein